MKQRKWNKTHEWATHNHSGHDHAKHPAYVYGKSGNYRKFLCFTHSKSTNGKENVRLQKNIDPSDSRKCYLVPRFVIESHNKLSPTNKKYRIAPEDRETVKRYKK